jgi:hypothetical protein
MIVKGMCRVESALNMVCEISSDVGIYKFLNICELGTVMYITIDNTAFYVASVVCRV